MWDFADSGENCYLKFSISKSVKSNTLKYTKIDQKAYKNKPMANYYKQSLSCINSDERHGPLSS